MFAFLVGTVSLPADGGRLRGQFVFGLVNQSRMLRELSRPLKSEEYKINSLPHKTTAFMMIIINSRLPIYVIVTFPV